MFRGEVEPVALGSRLRARRKALGLSQYALGRAVGVSNAFISSLEKGERMPSVETLVHLCGCLDVSLDALVFGDNCCGDASCPLLRDLQRVLKMRGGKEKTGSKFDPVGG